MPEEFGSEFYAELLTEAINQYVPEHTQQGGRSMLHKSVDWFVSRVEELEGRVETLNHENSMLAEQLMGDG